MSAQKSPIQVLLDRVEWKPCTAWKPVVENATIPLIEGDRTRDLPLATHEGILDLCGTPLRVYQLSDGSRIFDSHDLEEFFGLEFVQPLDSAPARPPDDENANEKAGFVR